MAPPDAVPTVPAAPTVPAVPGPMRRAILAWFDLDDRPLAFRGIRDPWAILVSEAMAQQTQAARAAEAWTRFLITFPTPEALAASSPADVLRAWRGLGYNRRALALRASAITIVTEHGGRVPEDLEALMRLPGVGPYTGRAVAALAFDRRVGAVDTNVRRVLDRAVGGRPGAFTPAQLQAVADASVPARGPGHWTSALMDLGARVCRSRAPRCDTCPAQRWCRAAAAGTAELPRDPQAAQVPERRARTGAPSGARPGARSGARSGARPGARSGGRSGAAPARPQPHRSREAPASFTATSRWLRGRILDRLRDAPPGSWAGIDAPFGSHEAGAVETALTALAREGLLERHPSDPSLARLPTA